MCRALSPHRDRNGIYLYIVADEPTATGVYAEWGFNIDWKHPGHDYATGMMTSESGTFVKVLSVEMVILGEDGTDFIKQVPFLVLDFDNGRDYRAIFYKFMQLGETFARASTVQMCPKESAYVITLLSKVS